jgi:hypothetical protein
MHNKALSLCEQPREYPPPFETVGFLLTIKMRYNTHMTNYNSNYAGGMGVPMWIHAFGPVIFIIIIWTIFWKGLALWHAGRRGQPWWFVIMLVVNTVGILEIIYLFGVLKLKFADLFTKK